MQFRGTYRTRGAGRRALLAVIALGFLLAPRMAYGQTLTLDGAVLGLRMSLDSALLSVAKEHLAISPLAYPEKRELEWLVRDMFGKAVGFVHFVDNRIVAIARFHDGTTDGYDSKELQNRIAQAISDVPSLRTGKCVEASIVRDDLTFRCRSGKYLLYVTFRESKVDVNVVLAEDLSGWLLGSPP